MPTHTEYIYVQLRFAGGEPNEAHVVQAHAQYLSSSSWICHQYIMALGPHGAAQIFIGLLDTKVYAYMLSAWFIRGSVMYAQCLITASIQFSEHSETICTSK